MSDIFENSNEIVYKERKRWTFLALPFTFTVYTITPDMLTMDQGFFNRIEDDCYMYKIQDVKMNASLGERMFGLATLTCYTGDVTNPELKLVHIKHARDIKSYLLKQSEISRMKRRTINTVDIGANGVDLDGDGVIDN